jgi:BirA family biotin operon repressor/biotin-[acetyl-CoA-carboxylase] ligase
MERARRLAADLTTALPAIVLADHQTAGQGRRGARWWQAEGSLAVSIVLDERMVGVAVKPTWSLACGVVLAEAIAVLMPAVEPQVKWPNDLEVDGRGRPDYPRHRREYDRERGRCPTVAA